MAKTLRNILFDIHKWLGLNAALILIFMFVTGALLTLSDEAEKLLHPAIRAEAPGPDRASFGQIYDQLRADYPDGAITLIEQTPIAGAADSAYAWLPGRGPVLIWTDPQTAQVQAVTSDRVSYTKIVRQLHESLLVPSRLVYLAVASTSLVLLYMAISGLVAYRRFWRGFLRLPAPGADARGRWGGWHRLLGVWLAAYLLIQGVTGAFFLMGGLGMVKDAPDPQFAERTAPLPADFDGRALDRAVSIAMAEVPGFQPKTVVLPQTPADPLRIGGDQGAPTMVGEYVVMLNPETLTIEAQRAPQDKTGLVYLSGPLRELHKGTWFGATNRYLWVLLSLAAAVLAYAGWRVRAARIAPPQARAAGGRLADAWAAMGLLRWAYMALPLGILAMAVLRFVF